MHFPIQNPQYLIWVFAIILPMVFSLSFSDPRTTKASMLCGPSENSDINFIPKFIKLMEFLSENVTYDRWGHQSIGHPPPEIFGLAQCHEDLSQTDCLLCFAEARTKLPKCLPSNSARLYLDGCFLRYDNYSFFHETVDPKRDSLKCSDRTGVIEDPYMKMELTKKVEMVVKNVTETAVINGGFAAAEVKGGVVGVYALAQCWKTIDEKGCRECLANAVTRVIGCVPGGEGRVLNAGCYLRYSTKKFYGLGAESKQADDGLSKIGVIIASTVLAAIAITILSLFGAFIGYTRILKIREEQNKLSQIPDTINKSNLNFKYEMLEKATKFFDPSRKLGQGGAGSVFKGTLPDGRTVAVKRLFFNTRQWVDEFFNEVNLISGIQHKNLVRLLGCSIEGPESLMVYEYVPNKSLDQFLFDKNKTQILSWQQRMEIILGTADGIAYLHAGADSQMKIIHRDIKGSNVLLDENLTPKIADFGLARCFAGDKSHISTGIAGTLGYMAPEYLVRGQLTEKADVYAFGVLVLEIVCGRKNSAFTQGSASVLQTVWKHYKSNNLWETVDPSLKGDFSPKEASDVLQVGLLCTQASTALRPSMPEVVQMLNDKESEIPSPKQPPFLNSSVLGSDDSTKSSSINGLSLSRHSIAEMSSSSYKSAMISPESNGPSTVETSELR